MAITTNNPSVIPAKAETTCNLLWLDEVVINGRRRLDGPVTVRYVVASYASDGTFSGDTRAYQIADVFTLAADPSRPKLAALVAALLDAAQEDIAIREAPAPADQGGE